LTKSPHNYQHTPHTAATASRFLCCFAGGGTLCPTTCFSFSQASLLSAQCRHIRYRCSATRSRRCAFFVRLYRRSSAMFLSIVSVSIYLVRISLVLVIIRKEPGQYLVGAPLRLYAVQLAPCCVRRIWRCVYMGHRVPVPVAVPVRVIRACRPARPACAVQVRKTYGAIWVLPFFSQPDEPDLQTTAPFGCCFDESWHPISRINLKFGLSVRRCHHSC